jgi:arylsulfatase A-like enzyme
MLLVPLLLACAPQNALVIVADDVGVADLAEVAADGRAPNLTALANSGVRFVNAFANPTCSPSRRSLNFGRWYVRDSGAGCTLPPTGIEPPLADLSVADLAPGITGLFGKWHLGTNPLGAPWERAPIEHGYDVWYGTPGNLSSGIPPRGECGGSSYFDWTFVDGGFRPAVNSTAYQPGVVRDRLLTWWAQTRGPKLAVWTPSLAHGPFHAPPSDFLPPGYPPPRGARPCYEAMITSLDMQVGQVLATVSLANTLVIFVGDNGTPDQVTPVRGKAKTTTFERGIRVPFIVAGAGLRPGIATRMTHVADVLPTLADYWGIRPPAGIDGVSLFRRTFRNHVICGNQPTNDYCIRTPRWKLRRSGVPAQEELYDLASDPDEVAPLDPDSRPLITARLRALLYPELP